MNQEQLTSYVNHMWDDHILSPLMEYIKIPNKSPHFDKDWIKNGHMAKAVKLIADWCKQHAIKGMTLDVIQEGDRTPIILIDVPGEINDTILLYGHLDKQPEMTGWSEGLSPWTPVLRGDKLYGRGGADDGYAAFASLTALKALQEQNISHARCVILIEASEESGSDDLPYYIDALKDRIGTPDLVVCLDSGCGNYDQLWMTTSLRGLVGGTLKVDVLRQGIHSGYGSGIAPSCFRIIRQLINRIENQESGDIILEDLQVNIPDERVQQANKAAEVLGDAVSASIPFVNNMKPEGENSADRIIRRTWKPALSITGMDGMPLIENAGNVTLPSLTVKLSMRLAPTCSPEKAAAKLKQILEENPPHHASVAFEILDTGPGWNAPKEARWLIEAANEASQAFFGKEAMYMGEGGTIPFMGMLGDQFPQAQFLITGVLGPESNAHGPNEFLHIPTGKKLTACVAHVIAQHFKQHSIN